MNCKKLGLPTPKQIIDFYFKHNLIPDIVHGPGNDKIRQCDLLLMLALNKHRDKIEEFIFLNSYFHSNCTKTIHDGYKSLKADLLKSLEIFLSIEQIQAIKSGYHPEFNDKIYDEKNEYYKYGIEVKNRALKEYHDYINFRL